MEALRGIGIRIGAIRRRRGWTQEELAARIGRTSNAVSALETGKHMPSFDTMRRLAAALDVPIRDFFAGPGGGDADDPEQAALLSDLHEAARTLPLADLELAAGMVGLIAGRRGRDRRGA